MQIFRKGIAIDRILKKTKKYNKKAKDLNFKKKIFSKSNF